MRLAAIDGQIEAKPFDLSDALCNSTGLLLGAARRRVGQALVEADRLCLAADACRLRVSMWSLATAARQLTSYRKLLH